MNTLREEEEEEEEEVTIVRLKIDQSDLGI